LLYGKGPGSRKAAQHAQEDDVFGTTDSAAGLILLPLFIFVAEMAVVTLTTLRTIFVTRGRKYLAPCLGFFEVSIWLLAIGEVMKNLSNLSCYLAFAGGFTIGNFLGVLIEKRLAMGSAVVRIITPKNVEALMEGLKAASYGVTSIAGQGATGPVQVILTVVKRKELGQVLAIVKRFDPEVFYSIDDLQEASRGVSPLGRPNSLVRILHQIAPGVLTLPGPRTRGPLLDATGAQSN
jgi:uncharacterized protein YebE (UPF0316 family)